MLGPRIALEGNIGSGKSTLLRLLRSRGMRVIDEPLQRWRGKEAAHGSSNLLSMFYEDPKRWAFTFQSAAFFTRAEAAIDAFGEQGHGSSSWILERSLHSDKHCFATNCLNTGLFTQAEWELYLDIHGFTLRRFPQLMLSGLVYMRTTPSTCMARLTSRARKEESNISMQYLEQLHECHEDWLLPLGTTSRDTAVTSDADAQSYNLSRSVSADGLPVLVLDCNPHFASALEPSKAGEAAHLAPEGARELMASAVEGFMDELRSKS